MKPYLSIQNKGLYYLFYKSSVDNKIKRCKVLPETSNIDEAEIFKLNFIKEQNETQQQVIQESSSKTLFLSQFIPKLYEYLSHHVTQSTVALYHTAFTNLIEIIGDKLLTQITLFDIQDYKYKISDRMKKITVNKNVKCIRAAFNIAIERLELLEKNPAEKVELYKIEKNRVQYLQKAEIEKILSLIESQTYKNIILFALYSGCRLNEILTLQWKDLDFINNSIYIGNKEDLGHTVKNKKYRLLSLTDELKNILIDNKEHNAEDFVFVNKRGLKYGKDIVSRMFKYYCRKAGLPDYKFHYLRHTFATTAIKSGISIYHLKEILGHSSIEVTAKNYLHSTISDIQESMSKVSYGLELEKKDLIEEVRIAV